MHISISHECTWLPILFLQLLFAIATAQDNPGTPSVMPIPTPVWANESTLAFDKPIAVLFTHFTDRLDANYITRPGLRTLTNLSRKHQWPTVYLHEGNAAPQAYFYHERQPTAYVNSSLGHFDFDSGPLEHIVVAGGFYELCLNNTVRQAIENWRAVRGKRLLQITYVLDAIYGVASDSYTEDRFNATLRNWINDRPSSTLLMSSVMAQLKDRDDAWKFLSRRWGNVPDEFGLYVRYRGEITAIRFSTPGFPTVLIAYTTTADLAELVDDSGSAFVENATLANDEQ